MAQSNGDAAQALDVPVQEASVNNPLIPPSDSFMGVSPSGTDRKTNPEDTIRASEGASGGASPRFTGTIDSVLGKIEAYEKRAWLFIRRKDLYGTQQVYWQCKKILKNYRDSLETEVENEESDQVVMPAVPDGSGIWHSTSISGEFASGIGPHSLDSMRISLRIAHCQRVSGIVSFNAGHISEANVELYKSITTLNAIMDHFGLSARENEEHLLVLEGKIGKGLRGLLADKKESISLKTPRVRSVFRWKSGQKESSIHPIVGFRTKRAELGSILPSSPIPLKEFMLTIGDYWRAMDALAHCYYSSARTHAEGSVGRGKLCISAVRMYMKAIFVLHEQLNDAYTPMSAPPLAPDQKILIASDLVGVILSLGKAYYSGEFFDEAFTCTSTARHVAKEYELAAWTRDIVLLENLVRKRRRVAVAIFAVQKIMATWRRYLAQRQLAGLRGQRQSVCALMVIVVASSLYIAPRLNPPGDLEVMLKRLGHSVVSPRLARHKVVTLEQFVAVTPDRFPMLGLEKELGYKLTRLARKALADTAELKRIKNAPSSAPESGALAAKAPKQPKPPESSPKPGTQFRNLKGEGKQPVPPLDIHSLTPQPPATAKASPEEGSSVPTKQANGPDPTPPPTQPNPLVRRPGHTANK